MISNLDQLIQEFVDAELNGHPVRVFKDKHAADVYIVTMRWPIEMGTRINELFLYLEKYWPSIEFFCRQCDYESESPDGETTHISLEFLVCLKKKFDYGKPEEVEEA